MRITKTIGDWRKQMISGFGAFARNQKALFHRLEKKILATSRKSGAKSSPRKNATASAPPASKPTVEGSNWLDVGINRFTGGDLWEHPTWRWVMLTVAAILFVITVTVPMSISWQLVYGGAIFGLSLILRRYTGIIFTLLLTVLSLNISPATLGGLNLTW